MKNLLLILFFACSLNANQIVIVIAGEGSAISGGVTGDSSAPYPEQTNGKLRLWWGNDSMISPLSEPSSHGFSATSAFYKTVESTAGSIATTIACSLSLGASDSVIMIHCTRSGSGLDVNDTTIKEKRWDKRGLPGSEFSDMITHCKAAPNPVNYLVWWQGETDEMGYHGGGEAGRYKSELKKLIQDTRDSLGIANLPWLFVMPGSTYPVATQLYTLRVRKALQEVCDSVPNCYLAASPLRENKIWDSVEVNMAGLIRIGGRVARTINYLRGNAAYYKGNWTATITNDAPKTTYKAVYSCDLGPIVWGNFAGKNYKNNFRFYLGEGIIYPSTLTLSADTLTAVFPYPLQFAGQLRLASQTLVFIDTTLVPYSLNEQFPMPYFLSIPKIGND